MSKFSLLHLALLLLISVRLPAYSSSQTLTIPHFATAAAAREWSEQQERSGHFELASEGYFREAAMRRALGDEQAAEVEELRANRLATSIQLAVPIPQIVPNYPLAKIEPAQGCYIGVRDEEGANADSFVQRLGRPISIVYDYLAYGDPFPMTWARQQANAGRAIQIAWEPSEVSSVRDDDYLESFARLAANCGTGVFIRFGGEMNGNWTTWGRNPAAYVAGFRTVHDVMARIAPNVAMVWAPNQVPLGNLDRYYPGDRYVDWVGISLYTVRYYDDNLSEPAYNDSPATMIAPFYRKYAARKPLCVVECGISRRSRVEGTDADSFAAARMTDLMNALRVRYPRLKMICFFDRNNLTGAVPNRRLNDYSLPAGSLVLASLQQSASDRYFIEHYGSAAASPVSYLSITHTFPKHYSGPVLASVITYDLHPSIQLKQGTNIQILYRPYDGQIDTRQGPVTVSVLDSHGNVADAYIVNP